MISPFDFQLEELLSDKGEISRHDTNGLTIPTPPVETRSFLQQTGGRRLVCASWDYRIDAAFHFHRPAPPDRVAMKISLQIKSNIKIID